MTIASPSASASHSASVFSAAPLTDADQLRLPRGSVARELLETPWKFDFFQSVLLLQQVTASNSGAATAPLGRFSRPSDEAMRFAVPDSLAFPGATIQAIGWNFAEGRPVVRVNFMGLTGPSGMLPDVYTERLQRIDLGPRHENRHALRDWLDNFNHRLISLFFDAWAKYRFPVAIERQRIESERGRKRATTVRVALSAVAGLDPQHREQAIDRDELLGLAGMFAQRPMTVCNLQAALQRSLGVPIRIRQFQPEWLVVEPDSQTSLGIANGILGRDALVGERIWSRAQKILIEVGPLSSEDFPRFLPPTGENPGDAYRKLAELVRLAIGPSTEFDIRPMLKVEGPLDVRLSAADEANRLGIDSWMGTPENAETVGDAVFAGGT